jgi:hypothetical protein
MPPQQAYGLLDFVDEVLDFVTHFGLDESCLARPLSSGADHR